MAALDLKKRRGRMTKRRTLGVALASLLAVGLSFMGILYFQPMPIPPCPVPSFPAQPSSQEPAHRVVEGVVKEKGTLFKSLLDHKIMPLQCIDMVLSKLRPLIDFKRIKGGTYRFILDMQGTLVNFVYEAGPADVYEVCKNPSGYVARKREIPLDCLLVKVTGEVRSSFFEAMTAAGEQERLALALSEILAWEIDFFKEVREGDRFSVIVEKIYKEGTFIGYGPIHAVQYRQDERVVTGCLYGEEWYNDKGVSLKKAFLKVPLRFNLISSKFSRARRHPILGGVHPHLGVDYAAPQGTPVWAVADGTVVSCGWSGGFGKQVVMRHKNGDKTYYGHLSRFGPGVSVGKRVKQKQVIGYVGSTGLSTGPHLDFRIFRDGKFRNPLRERFQEGSPLSARDVAPFMQRKEKLVTWLEAESPSGRETIRINDRE